MKFQTLVLMLLLGIGLLTSSCEGDGEVAIQDFGIAPDFSIETWDGNELSFDTYNNKLLVIFFFGNTCPPCIGVGPEVEERLNQDLSGRNDYAIIGIDQWDGNNDSVKGFQLNTGVNFPLGVIGSPVAKAYNTTYDRLVVVSKEGNIVYKGSSNVSNHIDEVVTLIDQLLE